jgi:hypothetical protein
MNALYEEQFDSSVVLKQNNWTQDALAGLPTCKGVLLLADPSGKPIQLLEAANCRRTAQAKLLHEDTDPATRKTDVSDLTTVIYYTCCYNHFLSRITYTQLARAVFGKDAANWIQLPKISLAAIEMNAFLPYFYITDAQTEHHDPKRFGLFPSRKAAADFCEILNTVFVLCRNPALLKTGKEPSCPYLQMQTCPGPCLNETLRAGYAEAVHQAAQTAAGTIEIPQQQLQQQMQQASKRMEFEQAQRCKKKLDLLEKLTRPDFQYVHPLEDLCFLHIDTGPKVSIEGQKRKPQQLMWFKVTSQGAFHLGDFVPDMENSIAEFLETRWTKNLTPLPLKDRKERLSVLSLQLFKNNPSGIWIDCANGLWIEKITAALNKNKPQQHGAQAT